MVTLNLIQIKPRGLGPATDKLTIERFSIISQNWCSEYLSLVRQKTAEECDAVFEEEEEEEELKRSLENVFEDEDFPERSGEALWEAEGWVWVGGGKGSKITCFVVVVVQN